MACGCALEKPVHGARIILRCQPGWDIVMEIKIPSIFGRCKIIHPGQNTDEMPGNAVIRHNRGNESHPQNYAQFRRCEHERGQGTARDDVQYGQGQEWEKQCEREMAAADIGAAHVVGHPLVPQDGCDDDHDGYKNSPGRYSAAALNLSCSICRCFCHLIPNANRGLRGLRKPRRLRPAWAWAHR